MVTYLLHKRLLNLFTPLGKDVLLPAAFSGREPISRLFDYHLEMFSTNEHISPKDIVPWLWFLSLSPSTRRSCREQSP